MIQSTKTNTQSQRMRKSQLPRSILIIQPGNAGDIVIASPIAEAIKNTYPNASVSWLTEPAHTHLLLNNTHVDEVLIWDKRKWAGMRKKNNILGLISELLTIRQTLIKKNFESVIDLKGTLSTGLISRSTNAKYRIGLASHKGNQWFMTKTISSNTGDKIQIGSQYRYLCDQLELNYTNWNMQAPTTPDTTKRITSLLQQKNINEDHAVVIPFSNTKERHWPEEYWQQLILRIRGKHQLRTIILANKNQKESADKLAKACGAIAFAGTLNTEECSAAIKSAKLCIGIDSALTHTGYALNTPTIALFGASCPYSFTEYPASKVIYTDRFCSPCNNKPSCNGKFQCMSEILPDRVLAEIKTLLKQAKQ